MYAQIKKTTNHPHPPTVNHPTVSLLYLVLLSTNSTVDDVIVIDLSHKYMQLHVLDRTLVQLHEVFQHYHLVLLTVVLLHAQYVKASCLERKFIMMF